MVEITTAEYIQIIAAGIYATALFYTIVTFRRSKKIDQITLGDRIGLLMAFSLSPRQPYAEMIVSNRKNN